MTTNKAVAFLFAQCKNHSCSAANLRLYDNQVWSYYQPIAYRPSWGNNVFFVDISSYSSTTSRHQGLIMTELAKANHDNVLALELPFPATWKAADIEKALKAMYHTAASKRHTKAGKQRMAVIDKNYKLAKALYPEYGWTLTKPLNIPTTTV